MRIAFFLAGLVFLVSCDQKETIEHYSTGAIKLECETENGRKHGECIKYYSNGQVEFTSNYKDDTLHGKSIFYHPNGFIHWEVDFDHGEKNGTILYYDSLGKVYQKSTFLNSILSGESLTYFENGSIASRMTYKEGELNGQYESYHKNRKVNTRATYQNGERLDFTTYDSSGQIIDHLIKYDISHNFTQDSIRIHISLINPLHDVFGFRIMDYDKENDSTLSVSDEIYSLTNELDYNLKIPEQSDTLILRGTIFELDTLQGGEGVVRSSINMQYLIKIDRST